MNLDTNDLRISLHRVRGLSVPYGSTEAKLPDTLDVELEGTVKLSYTLEEVAGREDELAEDVFLEWLRNEPVSVDDERKLIITDFEVLHLKCKNSTITVTIEPTDFEWADRRRDNAIHAS